MPVLTAARAYVARRPIAIRVLEILAPASVVAALVPEIQLVFGKDALIGWGLGMIGCIVAGVAEMTRRHRPPSTGSEPHSEGAQRLSAPAMGGLCLVLFVASIAFLLQADIETANYERSGLFIIAYSVCRLLLAVFVLHMCFTLGSLVLRALAPGFRQQLASNGIHFVVCFFVGASLLGLVLVAVGSVGLIGLPASLLLSLPLVALTPSQVVPVYRSAYHKGRAQLRALQGPQYWVQVVLISCTAVACTLLILARGLYPGQTTNDVWEHYLHYYRHVLESGSLGPHPTWYHFHLSKGAGLFYLTGSLSDALAPQLVSLCFILVAGLVVYLIVRRLTGESSWALLGMIVAYSTYRGDFFKHHDALAAFVVFFIWATMELTDKKDAARRATTLAIPCVAFYGGFYLPVGSAIVAAFWLGVLLLVCLLPSWRPRAATVALSLLALLAGVVATMLYNYGATGVAEMVPLGLFWSVADQAKFTEVFGPAGIPFLLDSEADRMDVSAPLGWWLMQCFRYHHLQIIFPPALLAPTLLAGVIYAVRTRTLWPPVTAGYPLAVLAMFGVPALLLSYLIRNVSLSRMYAFSSLLLAVVLVALIKVVMDALCTRSIRPRANAALLSVLGIFCIGQSLWYQDHTWGVTRQSLTSFFLGQDSMAQVMHRNDKLFDPQATIDVIYPMRKLLGTGRTVVNLGHDPGPANAFPSPGLMGGINHALGPQHLDVIFADPGRARDILRRREIDFFLYNLGNSLSNSLAYSQLFRPDSLGRYFRVAMYSDDTYVLTWRDTGHTDPIPPRFLQVFELAQTDVLRYANSTSFRSALDGIIEAEISRIVETAMQAGSSGQIRPLTAASGATERMARSTVALMATPFDQVRVPQNRVLLNRLSQEIFVALRGFLPELDSQVRTWMSSKRVPEQDRLEVYQQEFTRLLQATVTLLAGKQLEQEFSDKTAAMLTAGGRNRMARVFSSRANVEAIMRGEAGVGAGEDRAWRLE